MSGDLAVRDSSIRPDWWRERRAERQAHRRRPVLYATMPDQQHEPTDAEGPLFRAAHRHADAVDRAATAPERRKAWVRLVPSALAAFAEGLLREYALLGALGTCLFALIFGITSGHPGWTFGLVTSAICGCAVLAVAFLRRWSFGKQWLVLLSVMTLNVGLIVAMEQLTG